MNNVNIIGNLTKLPELRKTSDGKPVCGFCIAAPAGKDKAYFIDCVAWGDKAETIAQNFKKGDKIGITGMITTRMFEHNGENRKSTEVTVLSFDFCNGRKTEHQEDQAVAPSGSEEKTEPPIAPKMTESERAASVGVEPTAKGNLPFEI